MKYLIDLHTHCTAGGHAYSTFQENVLAAHGKGLMVYGLSEHAPAMPGGPHVFFFGNMKVLPGEYKGMRILKGCEANIVDFEGHLDIPDAILGGLDYAIASLHIPCIKPGTAEENTSSLIAAMDNPNVRIIGHPDDSRYPVDYEKLVPAAKEKGVLLEVNNTSLSPVTYREHGTENVKTYLKLCKELEVPVILGTDSHYCDYIGDFGYADAVLKEMDFPEELMVNTDMEKLRRFIPNL